MDNKLNAGAAAYTPGAPPATMQDSFKEYSEMVESIEDEMDGQEINNLSEAMNNTGVAVAPQTTALPAHMAAHAAEFWFPECRDCSCCKGFKHGCQCAVANGGVCTCSPQSAPVPKSTAAAPTKSKPICKFFRSPSGCKFGAGCRFAHS